MLGLPENANGLSKRQAILFDSVFGNQTGVRNFAGNNPALRKMGVDVI
jgi:hypothetical protein